MQAELVKQGDILHDVLSISEVYVGIVALVLAIIAVLSESDQVRELNDRRFICWPLAHLKWLCSGLAVHLFLQIVTRMQVLSTDGVLFKEFHGADHAELAIGSIVLGVLGSGAYLLNQLAERIRALP